MEQIWKIPHLLMNLTKTMTIQRGDILMTGSPFNNDEPLKPGDNISGRLIYDRRSVVKAETLLVERE